MRLRSPAPRLSIMELNLALRRMTIRQALVVWAITGVLSVVTLAGASVISNNLLSSTQDRLVSTALPLEEASRGISLVVTNLIVRQNKILTAEFSKDLESLQARGSLEETFKVEREKLAKLQGEVQGIDEVLNQLDSTYQNFLDIDQLLFDKTRAILSLREYLDGLAKKIDVEVHNIQTTAEGISGKVNFAIKRIQSKIRRVVEDPTQSEQLRSLVSEMITGVQADSQQTSNEIRIGVALLSTLSRQIMLEKSKDTLVSIKDNQIVQVVQLLRGVLNAMKNSFEGSSELLAATQQLNDDFNKLVGLLIEGDQSAFALRMQSITQEEDLQTLLESVRSSVASTTESLNDLSRLASEIRNSAISRSDQVVLTSRKIVLLVGVAVLLLVLGMAYYSTVSIIRPIKETSAALQDIAEGEGDLTQRLDANRTGEIGELSRWFNAFIDKLHRIISSVVETTREVNLSAGEILAAVTEQAAIVTQQSSSVSEITSTMEELSTSSKHIADHSQSVVEISTKALRTAEKGAEAVESVMKKMDEINRDSQNSINEIVELGKRSKEITKVMEIINNIADQTKLIAFNAAIEAASAGEAGKRFGVVAAEIRRLATSVMESTGEIESQINEIQQAVNRLVIASEKSSKGIQEGMASSFQTVELLKDILAGAQSTTDAAKQISLSTQQQKTASDQVVIALKEIAEGSKQTSISINQTTSISKSLADLSGNLQRLVEKFKLRGDQEN